MVYKFDKENPTTRRIEITDETIDKGFMANSRQWLIDYAANHQDLGLGWLLAHADDGVIWGRLDAGNHMSLSSDNFNDLIGISPALQAITLQQLRFFGECAELHIWRVGKQQFQARLLAETDAGETKKCFDETQILWGNRAEGQENKYTLVTEGQGIRHIVPLDVPEDRFADDKRRPLRLQLRHYLDHDDIGQARIYLSRLVNVYAV